MTQILQGAFDRGKKNMKERAEDYAKGFDLNGLAAESVEIAKKRAENGGTESFSVQNLLKHCAMEVVEAMEAYTLMSEDFRRKGCCDNINFSSELADIVCCCMIVAGYEGIDLEKAIECCVEKNRLRAKGKEPARSFL